MATLPNSGQCEVMKDEGISDSDVKDALAVFLRKKDVREEILEDDYAKLSRFQKSLQEQLEHDSKASHKKPSVAKSKTKKRKAK